MHSLYYHESLFAWCYQSKGLRENREKMINCESINVHIRKEEATMMSLYTRKKGGKVS
jgi:hypothetical protein